MHVKERWLPSIEEVSSYWAQRGERYGPERIGASFEWMDSFASKTAAEAAFDREENDLLSLVMEFLTYSKCAAGLQGRLRVLEEGSGAGNLTVRLAALPEAYLVTGIDICQPLLDYSRQRLLREEFAETAERIHFGIAQNIRPVPNARRLLPPPKIFERESMDLIIWGRLDHRLLGLTFYEALKQATEVLIDRGILVLYSLSKWDNPPSNDPLFQRWTWVKDEDDYQHFANILEAENRTHLKAIGSRWSHTHCKRNYFLRVLQKRTF